MEDTFQANVKSKSSNAKSRQSSLLLLNLKTSNTHTYPLVRQEPIYPLENFSSRQNIRNILRKYPNRNQHHISIASCRTTGNSGNVSFSRDQNPQTRPKFQLLGQNRTSIRKARGPQPLPVSSCQILPSMQYSKISNAAEVGERPKNPTQENVGETFTATVAASKRSMKRKQSSPKSSSCKPCQIFKCTVQKQNAENLACSSFQPSAPPAP